MTDEEVFEYPIRTTQRNAFGRISEQEFVVKYGPTFDGEWAVSIKWTCGDTVGRWSVAQFEDLLKQIAKVPASKGLILPVEIFDYDTYGVMLADDGTVLYGDSVGYMDSRGPSLAELKKALASIKRYIKKQSPPVRQKKEVPV